MSYLSAGQKATLKRSLGHADAFIHDSDGQKLTKLYDVLFNLVAGLKNRVARGLVATAPTSASTQATGTGTTAWRVGLSQGTALVDGVSFEQAAGDFTVASAGSLLAAGQSLVADLVVKSSKAPGKSGTASLVAVLGAPNTTGSQAAPTDAAVQAAVGAGLPWVRVARCTLNRTGDLTVTQSQDNTACDLGLEVVAEFIER